MWLRHEISVFFSIFLKDVTFEFTGLREKPEPNKKLLSLFEMFVTDDVLCGPDEREPWMVARVARREWLSIYTRYLMHRGVTIVRNFVDPRFRNFISGFKFFRHVNLLGVSSRNGKNSTL
jgi:hypothetical protein